MTDAQKVMIKLKLKDATLDELCKKVVVMEKKRLEIKKFYEESDLLLQEISNRYAFVDEFHFQDDEGTVYQLAKWPGQFVVPKDYIINRTRVGDERSGGLSLTAARELGYEVEGQRAKPKKEATTESEIAGHPEGK